MTQTRRLTRCARAALFTPGRDRGGDAAARRARVDERPRNLAFTPRHSHLSKSAREACNAGVSGRVADATLASPPRPPGLRRGHLALPQAMPSLAEAIGWKSVCALLESLERTREKKLRAAKLQKFWAWAERTVGRPFADGETAVLKASLEVAVAISAAGQSGDGLPNCYSLVDTSAAHNARSASRY